MIVSQIPSSNFHCSFQFRPPLLLFEKIHGFSSLDSVHHIKASVIFNGKKKVRRERRKKEYSNVLDKVSEAPQDGKLANITGVASQLELQPEFSSSCSSYCTLTALPLKAFHQRQTNEHVHTL